MDGRKYISYCPKNWSSFASWQQQKFNMVERSWPRSHYQSVTDLDGNSRGLTSSIAFFPLHHAAPTLKLDGWHQMLCRLFKLIIQKYTYAWHYSGRRKRAELIKTAGRIYDNSSRLYHHSFDLSFSIMSGNPSMIRHGYCLCLGPSTKWDHQHTWVKVPRWSEVWFHPCCSENSTQRRPDILHLLYVHISQLPLFLIIWICCQLEGNK